MSYYEVKLNNINIYNPAVREMLLLDPVVNLSVTESGSFDFIMPPCHVFYEEIVPMASTIEVFEDGVSIFYGRALPPTKDMWGNKTYHCEGPLAFLSDIQMDPTEFDVEEESLMSAQLTELFNFYNDSDRLSTRALTLGSISLRSNPSRTMDFDYGQNCLDAFRNILSYTGGYVLTRRSNGITYIDIVKNFENAATGGQPIRLGMNILDIIQTGQPFYTGVMAKGGQQIVEVENEDGETEEQIVDIYTPYPVVLDQTAVARFGMICAYQEFLNADTQEELTAECMAFLQQNQFEKFSIEVDALDLHLTKSTYSQLKLGTQVKIDATPLGIDQNISLPISKMQVPLDSGNKRVTVGTPAQQTLTIDQMQLKISGTDNEEIKKNKKKIKKNTDDISDLDDRVTDIEHGAISGYSIWIGSASEYSSISHDNNTIYFIYGSSYGGDYYEDASV